MTAPAQRDPRLIHDHPEQLPAEQGIQQRIRPSTGVMALPLRGRVIFKTVDGEGKTSYSDRPNESHAESHAQAKVLIAKARKHIPKLLEYLDALDYLRRRNPEEFDRAMSALQKSHPELWLKLQKYPAYRPLVDSMRYEGLGGVLSVAKSKFDPDIAFGEAIKTVRKLQVREGYGAASSIPKGSTLPALPAATYSNSRLGQFLKDFDAQSTQLSKQAASAMKSSDSAVRAGRATAATRLMGPLLEVGIMALNMDQVQGVSALRGQWLGQRLFAQGFIEGHEALELRNAFARGDYADALVILQLAQERYEAQ